MTIICAMCRKEIKAFWVKLSIFLRKRNINCILISFKLLGRWGTWNYKNMDLCIKDAMELAEEY